MSLTCILKLTVKGEAVMETWPPFSCEAIMSDEILIDDIVKLIADSEYGTHPNMADHPIVKSRLRGIAIAIIVRVRADKIIIPSQ